MFKSDIFLLMRGHGVGRQYPDNEDVSCCFIQLFHTLLRLYSVTCFECIVKGRYISAPPLLERNAATAGSLGLKEFPNFTTSFPADEASPPAKQVRLVTFGSRPHDNSKIEQAEFFMCFSFFWMRGGGCSRGHKWVNLGLCEVSAFRARRSMSPSINL